jgi:hypothetical protein
MSKTIEEHVNDFRAARNIGILGMFSEKSFQVTDDLIIELANGNYSFASRPSDDFPFEVSTTINGIKYFTICDEEEFKNTFGGNANELTTTN